MEKDSVGGRQAKAMQKGKAGAKMSFFSSCSREENEGDMFDSWLPPHSMPCPKVQEREREREGKPSHGNVPVHVPANPW